MATQPVSSCSSPLKLQRLTHFVRESPVPKKDGPPSLPHYINSAVYCTRGNTVRPSLPLYRDGSFQTSERFVREVRQLVTAAGIHPMPHSGHRFCIGVATTAMHAGLDATLIQTLGRCKSSDYQLYICIP